MRRMILLACLLTFSLSSTLSLRAEQAEELQIFEFDYDHQNEAPFVNLPPTLQTPPPRSAPAQAAKPAAAPPAAKAAPAPGQPAAAQPVPAPVKPEAPVFVEDPISQAPPAAETQPKVITIIGEPQSPAPKPGLSDEELLETLFSSPQPQGTPAAPQPAAPQNPESISLSPAGAPPTTSVPAKPGEALVEKKGTKTPIVVAPGVSPATVSVSKGSGKAPAAPAKSGAAPRKAAGRKTASPQPVKAAEAATRTPGGALYPVAPGRTAADYRFWELAMANWSKVSGADYASGSSLSRSRAVYPIDKALIPTAGPNRPAPKNFW